MIIGAHTIIYSSKPEADRAFLRDVLRFANVDAGEGWLIFGLPPAEIAVHPSDKNDIQELYLMCDDVESFIVEMENHHILCGPVQDRGWGLLTQMTLPGGGKLGIYQPRHARPAAMSTRKKSRGRAARTTKKPVKNKGGKTPRKARRR